jgi:hypothetical protein
MEDRRTDEIERCRHSIERDGWCRGPSLPGRPRHGGDGIRPWLYLSNLNSWYSQRGWTPWSSTRMTTAAHTSS